MATRATNVAAWPPSGTYKQSDLTYVRAEIVNLLNRTKQVVDTVGADAAWRAEVDAKLDEIFKALIFLARQVSGQIFD